MSELKAISIHELEGLLKQGVNLVDFRSAEEFCEGFIPESLFVPDAWLNQRRLKLVLQQGQGIVIIAADDKEARAYAQKLSDIKIGPILGYLEGGYDTWQSANKPIDVVVSVEPFEMATSIRYE